VIAAKRAMMSAGKIVNYRLFAQWDASHPRALADSLSKAMGFTPGAGPDPATSYSDVGRQTLADLAKSVKGSLNTRSMRATGSPRAPVSRVAIVNGMPNVPHIGRAIADLRVNAIIVGETCEWEGTPYFQDVIASGRNIGMLLVGYGVSDEPGMNEVAEFVRKAASGIPVRVATDSDLAWIS
jgi:putative NIF3 family GTP cyclohydrolase 1 type 2